MTLPVTLAASIAIGIWLLFAPAVLGGAGMAANSDRLVGALVVTIAAISTAEVVRALRFVNLLAALWLGIAPWVVTGGTTAMAWNDVVCAIVLFVLTLPRGAVRETYGRWDRWIF